MIRIAPVFFLVGCLPVLADLLAPGSQPQSCDTTIEVDGEWSHPTVDYGFMRRINAFDVAGERFEQKSHVARPFAFHEATRRAG